MMLIIQIICYFRWKTSVGRWNRCR